MTKAKKTNGRYGQRTARLQTWIEPWRMETIEEYAHSLPVKSTVSSVVYQWISEKMTELGIGQPPMIAVKRNK